MFANGHNLVLCVRARVRAYVCAGSCARARVCMCVCRVLLRFHAVHEDDKMSSFRFWRNLQAAPIFHQRMRVCISRLPASNSHILSTPKLCPFYSAVGGNINCA